MLEQTGDVAVAIETGEKCLAMARELGHDCVEAEVLEHLGSAYGRTGDHERELDCYRASLRLHEKEGNDRGGAGVLRRIGALHRRSGRAEDAIAVLSESLAVFRVESDPAGEAACLEELGLAHLLRGDLAGGPGRVAPRAGHRGAVRRPRRQASLRRHLAMWRFVEVVAVEVLASNHRRHDNSRSLARRPRRCARRRGRRRRRARRLSAPDGKCDNNEFCLLHISTVSLSDFASSSTNYGETQPSCFEYRTPGCSAIECVKNNAARACN